MQRDRDVSQSYKSPPAIAAVASAKPLVAIGSRNPAKTVGAKNVFQAYFPGCGFTEVDTRTVARAQPMGMDQVAEGALARARFALAESRADFGVGVEAGIISLTSGESINLQIAVVVDREGRSGIGLSSGFMIPASFVERMRKEGTELDSHSHELTRAEKISEEEGIVYPLTKGRMSRLQMTEQCVGMALVPWLNPSSYGQGPETTRSGER
jgi:inosine/xanthosine triphosphatase